MKYDPMAPFYKGWSLFGAIDALKAYDHGCTDSGVGDDDMRAAVGLHLKRMDDDEFDTFFALYASWMLARGQTMRDIITLVRWIYDNYRIVD